MDALLSPSRRTLLILCLASGGWAFSFGVGATLASPFLADAGFDKTTIGLNTSAYYFWVALRLLAGAAAALSIIPIETWVNHNAPPPRRARDFGLYAFSVALGVGLGPVAALPLYPVAPKLAFVLGGAASLGSAALAWWGLPARAAGAEEAPGAAPLSVAANGLSFGTAWIQGFLEGGMITFLSVYLLGLNYSEAHAGLLIGVLFLGVVAFQVPGAWLADRVGRTRVLLGCQAVVLAGMVCLPFYAGPVWLCVWLFLIGACCAALYPLGLAVLGERVPRAALGKANAWYLASNCAGSLSGPVVMGLAVEWFDWRGLFAAGAAAVGVVALGGVLWERWRNRHSAAATWTNGRKAA
jgi:UMF2 family putative MFS family transporter